MARGEAISRPQLQSIIRPFIRRAMVAQVSPYPPQEEDDVPVDNCLMQTTTHKAAHSESAAPSLSKRVSTGREEDQNLLQIVDWTGETYVNERYTLLWWLFSLCNARGFDGDLPDWQIKWNLRLLNFVKTLQFDVATILLTMSWLIHAYVWLIGSHDPSWPSRCNATLLGTPAELAALPNRDDREHPRWMVASLVIGWPIMLLVGVTLHWSLFCLSWRTFVPWFNLFNYIRFATFYWICSTAVRRARARTADTPTPKPCPGVPACVLSAVLVGEIVPAAMRRLRVHPVEWRRRVGALSRDALLPELLAARLLYHHHARDRVWLQRVLPVRAARVLSAVAARL